MARPLIVYTLLRIVMFVGAFGLVTIAGSRGALSILLALVLSAVGSALLLRPQRDAIAVAASARKQASAEERARLQARLRDEQA